MSKKLGIGITTYNRKDKLKKCIEKIKLNTSCDYDLVVADDGSTDDTISFLKEIGINYISGENKGIAWNKNRAIFSLLNFYKSDIIILIEDDCYPEEKNWQNDWMNAAKKWGHVNLAGDWFETNFVSGRGIPEDLIKSTATSGQCVAFSRESLLYVGYMDTRFKKYGNEHIEHSLRFIRAGYGGEQHTQTLFYLLKSPIFVAHDHTYYNEQSVINNRKIYEEIRNESVYRLPWRNENEMAEFRSEQHAPEDANTKLPLLRENCSKIVMLDFTKKIDTVSTKEDMNFKSDFDPKNKYAIFGMITNYGFDYIHRFLSTWLKNAAKSTELIIFCDAISANSLEDKRGQFGYKLIRMDNYLRLPFHPLSVRFLAFRDFLSIYRQNFEKVLLCDLRDLIFQAEFFDLVPPDKGVFSLEENIIGNEPINDNWLKDLYGTDVWNEIKGNPIACCGTTCGGTSAIISYLNYMCHFIINHSTDERNFDQGIHNYICWKKIISNFFPDYNHEIVRTVGFTPDKIITFDDSGVLFSGKKTPIVHQWDRCKKIAEWVYSNKITLPET